MLEGHDVKIQLQIDQGGDAPRKVSELSRAIESATQAEQRYGHHLKQNNIELEKRAQMQSRAASATPAHMQQDFQAAHRATAGMANVTSPQSGQQMLRDVLGPQLGNLIAGTVATAIQNLANKGGFGVGGDRATSSLLLRIATGVERL